MLCESVELIIIPLQIETRTRAFAFLPYSVPSTFQVGTSGVIQTCHFTAINITKRLILRDARDYKLGLETHAILSSFATDSCAQ